MAKKYNIMKELIPTVKKVKRFLNITCQLLCLHAQCSEV